MATVAVRTRKTTRDKLSRMAGGNHELVVFLECVSEDVTGSLPDAASSASQAAQAAQASADAAQVSANSAQASADAAQNEIDTVQTASFVIISPAASIPNARSLAVDSKALSLVDGGAGASATLASADLIAILPGDVSDNTAAFVNATGLALSLIANATYIVDGILVFQTAAITTGIGFGFTIPAGATIVGLWQHNTTATALEGSYNISSGSVKADTSGALAATENIPVIGRWIIKTAGTAGSAQLQFRSEVAASSVTLKADITALIARRIA